MPGATDLVVFTRVTASSRPANPRPRPTCSHQPGPSFGREINDLSQTFIRPHATAAASRAVGSGGVQPLARLRRRPMAAPAARSRGCYGAERSAHHHSLAARLDARAAHDRLWR